MRKLRRSGLIRDPKEVVEWLKQRATRKGDCLITHLGRAKGYPATAVAGEDWEVHRLVFTVEKGPIPEGLSVLHSCDNKRCIEAAHLRVGTQADNLKDMAKRFRGRCSDWYNYQLKQKWRSV